MKAFASLLIALVSAFLLSPTTAKVQPADLVFKNGNIYTGNDVRPKAEAVAIKGDRIVFVGSNREVQQYVGSRTRVIDLSGKTMLPGMTDAHHHLSGVGFREMTLNLEGLTSLAAFLAKVKERASIRNNRASGSPVAVGLKRSGLRKHFQRAGTSTGSLQTTRSFWIVLTAMERWLTVRH